MSETLTGTCRWSVPKDGEWVLHLGRVWITREGDAEDHVLGAGERLSVRRGESLVIEPWTPGQASRWGFVAQRSGTGSVRLGLVTAGAGMLMALAGSLQRWARRLDPERLAAD